MALINYCKSISHYRRTLSGAKYFVFSLLNLTTRWSHLGVLFLPLKVRKILTFQNCNLERQKSLFFGNIAITLGENKITLDLFQTTIREVSSIIRENASKIRVEFYWISLFLCRKRIVMQQTPQIPRILHKQLHNYAFLNRSPRRYFRTNILRWILRDFGAIK